MPYATLAEAFASPIPIKQPTVAPPPVTNQEHAKRVALSEPVGANVPAGTPIEYRKTIPQADASMHAALPPVEETRVVMQAPGPNALATKKPVEPVPNSREPIHLPTSMFAQDDKATPISHIIENFMDKATSFTMPSNQEEWENMLRQILAYGIAKGWVLPQDLIVLFQHGTSRDWNLWLQEMIPYVLLGAFIVFFLNTAYKLFK